MRHKIYTGLGHHCGVIPYSSVVWWIASWANDEQYKEEQPREGLFLAGAMNYSGSSVALWMDLSIPLPCGWLALFIGKGPGPLPKY